MLVQLGWRTLRGGSCLLLGIFLAACGGGSGEAPVNAPAVTVDPNPATPATPGNAAPSIFGTPPTGVTANSAYAFTPAATDPDFDSLTFTIVNRPAWASFDPVTGSLSGTPDSSVVGTTSGIIIGVSDGALSASLQAFDLTVSADTAGSPAGVTITNTRPNHYIWTRLRDGQKVFVDRDYTFGNIPVLYEGLDYLMTANDDKFLNSPAAISFDVTSAVTVYVGYDSRISVLPAWLTSWTNTGDHWNGPGVQTDVYRRDFPAGSVVLGGNAMGFSMYNVAVEQQAGAPVPPPPSPGNINTPPTIGGTPPLTASQGAAYRFTPAAADADGDPLVFTIANRPGWASFNTSSGTLSGTPGPADAGTHAGILIGVSDGAASATLPAFGITVDSVASGSATLTWTAPTLNADGTPLTDLAGYTIYYSKTLGNYPTWIRINNPGVTTHIIDQLSAGTWFFVITAHDVWDNESNESTAASKTIVLP